MLLDFIKQKNNLITWSTSTKVNDELEGNKYSIKENIEWELALGALSAWIKLNLLETSDLYQVDFNVNGTYGGVLIQHSFDNINWVTLEKNEDNKWSGYEQIDFIYIRLYFTDIDPGFELTDLRVIGEETLEINKELISLTVKNIYPQSFYEQFPLLPDFIEKYYMMLERHEGTETIKKFFIDNLSVEVYLIFEDGEEGAGGINTFPLNSTPINASGASIFVGYSTAVINRVRGGFAFYDLDGNTEINLNFKSIVKGLDISEIAKNKYNWDFDDPFARDEWPSIVSTIIWGEQQHLFTKLGVYNVRFIVVRDGKIFEGSKEVEIAPAPLVITGPSHLQFERTDFVVEGLLRPYGDMTCTGGGYVIDNGDRIFTVVKNGGLGVDDLGTGKLLIYDNYYERWVSKIIYYKDVILDVDYNPILDSNSEEIYS